MDIAVWLRSLGLEHYEPAFRDNDIEAEMLRQLTADDLVALGVTSVGHRRKMLTAIAALGEVTPEPPASVPSRAERRQLTVMFIDLVGSTELSQRLDPEDMSEVIRNYQSAVSAEIVRYEGQVAKLMGDGVLAFFGWPQAHEDDAERAIRSGLAAAVATASLRGPEDEQLAARVGIATGLVVVGDLVGEGSAREEAVIGETPNLAARLQALAEPNTVVVADSTHRLTTGWFEAVDLGNQKLKGFAAPVRAWRVVGETGVESRFDALHGVATPLVGRAQELELLFERWEQAQLGKGQVVLLSGEPGIGKSRLVAAVDERLGDDSHIGLRYFCSPYHANSALHPVIKYIERAAGLGHQDSPNLKLDKLEVFLRRATPDLVETGPLFATLMSIDSSGRYAPLRLTPQAQRARTLSALIQQLELFAARQPVMMLVEDAHWMDPTTGEWLDMVIDRLKDLKVFLIVTFRPEFQPRWSRYSHVMAISLSRLGSDQSEAIVDRVAQGKSLPPEVSRQILDKTDGVPLFVEELTKSVLESGLVTYTGDRYVLSGALHPLSIPSTLQDSLMARLDRLVLAKEVAQIGACIGRVFDHRLLAAVIGNATRTEDDLQRLEKSELVFRRGVPPEATYAFKHALVQDIAYHSLLNRRRQQIHAVIASTLEAQFPEIVEAEPETLAHHYTTAGLADQGTSYWLKAGQLALKRSANIEAEAHLTRGLQFVPTLSDPMARLRRETSLQIALGTALTQTRGWAAPQVHNAYSKARQLCERLGDTHQLFVAIHGESAYYMNSGDLRAADELNQQGLELARGSGNPELLLEAYHLHWATKFHMADYADSEANADRGIALYDPERHHHLTYVYTGHDPGVCCRNHSAQILWLRGYPDRALERCRESVSLAERESHPVTVATALSTISLIHLQRGEPQEAHSWAEREVELTDKFALPFMAAQARFFLGWALADQGDVEKGIRAMRAGIEALSATGASQGIQHYLCALARVCGGKGDVGDGLTMLDKAFRFVAESHTHHQLPELLRTRGDLLLWQDPGDEGVETWFWQALTLACDQGAKSLELRAALSLAHFYFVRGRAEEARDLLAPIYAWFTEGFDRPDLMEARALLDSCRAL